MRTIIIVACMTLALGTARAQDIQPSKWAKGDAAPDFVAADTLGVSHSLTDWTGQWVVLDFWASWCGDCRRDFPEIKAIQQHYGSKATFVSLSMDHDGEAWKKCLRKEQFPWTQISNLQRWKENTVALAYDLHWIPSYFVIDAEGVIHGSYTNAADLRTALSELFGTE